MSGYQEILKAIADLKAELKGDITKLDTKITDDIAKLDTKITGDIAKLDTKIAKLDTKIDKIATEQQKDVIAILQLMDTRTERIEAKLDILNHKIFEQETDIQLLKKVK